MQPPAISKSKTLVDESGSVYEAAFRVNGKTFKHDEGQLCVLWCLGSDNVAAVVC